MILQKMIEMMNTITPHTSPRLLRACARLRMTHENMHRGILLMVLCGLTYSMHADYGRIPLIEYVIKQEAEIAQLQQSIKDLSKNKEVVDLQKRCQDLQRCVDITLHDIEIMADTGALFNVTDDFGKTALNYCKTKAIYCKLRRCGMPFQYDAYMSVYQDECFKVAIIGTAVVCVLYHQGFFEQLSKEFQEIVEELSDFFGKN